MKHEKAPRSARLRPAGLLTVVVLLGLVLALAACSGGASSSAKGAGTSASAQSATSGSSIPKGDGDAAVLKISGPGVASAQSLSLSQLKAMKSAQRKETFSVRNSWPTSKSFTAQGVSLADLLKAVGIKADAGVVTITGRDGYLAHFTPDQLLKPRQSFPGLAKQSAAGATSVDALLAWSWDEPGDAAPTTKLRNFVGQDSLTDVNSVISVQDVTSITVAAGPLEQWAAPQYDIARDGSARTVTLYHDSMDSVQIYYTLDGTEPTVNSALYNPSTSYYQPQLIVPIKAQAGATLKLLVVGYGKEPSKVESVAL